MTPTRWGLAMASIENRLFAIGGIGRTKYFINGGDDAGNMMETILLDEKMESKFWTLEKRIPFTVSFHCVVTVGDHIIVTGGVGYRNKILDTTYIYNVVTKEWTLGPKLKEKRKGHACFVDEETTTLHMIG